MTKDNTTPTLLLVLSVLAIVGVAAAITLSVLRSSPPLQCRTAPGTCVVDGRTVYCVLPDANQPSKRS